MEIRLREEKQEIDFVYLDEIDYDKYYICGLYNDVPFVVDSYGTMVSVLSGVKLGLCFKESFRFSFLDNVMCFYIKDDNAVKDYYAHVKNLIDIVTRNYE